MAAVAGDAHVAGDHALDLAIRAEHHIGDGEAGIDLDAERLGLLGEPFGQGAEAADIAAVIAHQRRHEDVRHADAAGLPQIIEAVLGDLGLERRAQVAPIGQQAVERHGIDHRAGQDMGADLGALLQHHHRDVPVLLGGKLLQPNRGGEPRGSGADNDDVELHGLAFGGLGLGRFAQGSAPKRRESFP